jgi:hypothetical protein
LIRAIRTHLGTTPSQYFLNTTVYEIESVSVGLHSRPTPFLGFLLLNQIAAHLLANPFKTPAHVVAFSLSGTASTGVARLRATRWTPDFPNRFSR